MVSIEVLRRFRPEAQAERRRLRIGDYRVVYTIDNGELMVWVVHVGHHSTAYDTQLLPVLRNVANSRTARPASSRVRPPLDYAIRR